MRRELPFGTVGGIGSGQRFEPKPMNVRAAREFVADALVDQGFGGDTDMVLGRLNYKFGGPAIARY